MKAVHRCFWVLLCLGFISSIWAQDRGQITRLAKHFTPQQRMAALLSKSRMTTHPGSYRAPANAPDKSRVWDLGVYPGGSASALQGVNDFGVAMGWGDVPIEGGTETRMIGVPLFGSKVGQWFDSGLAAGEDDTAEAGGISNTGMIVGNIMDSNGWPVAYAWIPNQGGFLLGKYADDDGSIAIAINHSGTLIVGNSGKLLEDGTVRATPLVWTSKVIWNHGQPTLSWKMHVLPTGGWEKPGAVFDGIALIAWGGEGVNDSGQIAGDGWFYDPVLDQYWEIAVVWTPIEGTKKWKIQRLPKSADLAYNEALAINDLGEIAGDVWGFDSDKFQGALPALWSMRNGKTWSLRVLPTTSGLDYGWNVAWGINELGDLVGYCTDENWIGKATRWNTHNRGFVKNLEFPGDTSGAFAVNSQAIAVGYYQSIVSYDEDGNPIFGPPQAVAVQFR